ncbi:hypothetical protein HW555_010939 [Spodoptera exigua]|uniref:Uncharacterized protein n=1 Tax=Spodoptera exigua TaxID=7107 RepID=A0A835GA36_SPOEX|nr:hypothetical protein HW555_010939 [Spodoptera exigua]
MVEIFHEEMQLQYLFMRNQNKMTYQENLQDLDFWKYLVNIQGHFWGGPGWYRPRFGPRFGPGFGPYYGPVIAPLPPPPPPFFYG